MQITETDIPDVLIIDPVVHRDPRGEFAEIIRASDFSSFTGGKNLVQINQSVSSKGVLRGLHCQMRHPQGKLVRVVHGEVFDVAVDLRRDSPTFGRSVSVVLSADNHRMLWIPEGFAHGFLVLSESACFIYGCTDYYDAASEQTILWNDPDLAICWPSVKNADGSVQAPVVSAKDAAAKAFRDALYF